MISVASCQGSIPTNGLKLGDARTYKVDENDVTNRSHAESELRGFLPHELTPFRFHATVRRFGHETCKERGPRV